MQAFTPRLFAMCLALALGPPAAMVAFYGRDLFTPLPINPNVVSGELLFFTSSGCPACKAMKPAVGQLRNEGFNVVTVDVNTQQDKAIRYGIRYVPTFVLVRDGQEVRRSTGFSSDEALRQMWR